ncbi:MAG TPA: hypothetical protein VFH61_17980 [Thermoleophilia bacterium]|nr:hypothetical protein [Thermoleophilia bacterium]
MTPSLVWSDDGAYLALRLGGVSVDIAFIEADSDGNATAYLYSWTGDNTESVYCQSRAEAIAVIRALVGIRAGVEVPCPSF